jgi:hypothetical protein
MQPITDYGKAKIREEVKDRLRQAFGWSEDIPGDPA